MNQTIDKRLAQRRKDDTEAAFDGICQNVLDGNDKILPFFKKERPESYKKIIARIKEMKQQFPEYKDVKVKGLDF